MTILANMTPAQRAEFLAAGDTSGLLTKDQATAGTGVNASGLVGSAAAQVDRAQCQIIGTPTVGVALSVSIGPGSSLNASLRYQWLRDGVAIGGATASTYTPVETDKLRMLSVTVTDGVTTLMSASVKVGYIGQVATRSYLANTKSGASTRGMCRTAHLATEDLTSLRVMYPAWYVTNGSNSAETASGVDLTYKVGLEYPAGYVTPVTWSGAPTKTATSGADTGLSDACKVAVPKGARFWLRVYVTSPTAAILSYIPASGTILDVANGEACEYGTSAVTDRSWSTGAITDSGSNAITAPIAIVAYTTKATFLLLGDSRDAGSGGAPNARGDTGELAPSFGAAGYAYINAGIGGDYATRQVKSYAKRSALAQYNSHVVIEGGVNDFGTSLGNRTDAQVRADRLALARLFRDRPVIGTTISPYTSGTYSSAGGQTVDANTPAIQSFNTWMRTVPSPFAAVLDIASVTEDPAAPGKWKSPGYTADGLHATTLGYSAIETSGVINPVVLADLSRAATAWSPAQLGGAFAWYDADNAGTTTADGSAFTSTLGDYPLQGTAGARPTLTANAIGGGAAYVFGGTAHLDGGAALKALTSGASAVTVALVAYATPGAGNTFLVNLSVGGSPNSRASVYIDSTGKIATGYRRLDADGSTNTVGGTVAANGSPFIFIATFDASNGYVENRLNGAVDASALPSTSGAISATSSSDAELGGSNGGSLLTGAEAQVLILPRALAIGDVQRIEGYLAARYGLQSLLPAAHPYKVTPPAL